MIYVRQIENLWTLLHPQNDERWASHSPNSLDSIPNFLQHNNIFSLLNLEEAAEEEEEGEEEEEEGEEELIVIYTFWFFPMNDYFLLCSCMCEQ